MLTVNAKEWLDTEKRKEIKLRLTRWLKNTHLAQFNAQTLSLETPLKALEKLANVFHQSKKALCSAQAKTTPSLTRVRKSYRLVIKTEQLDLGWLVF